jgi:hypothetical protein
MINLIDFSVALGKNSKHIYFLCLNLITKILEDAKWKKENWIPG